MATEAEQAIEAILMVAQEPVDPHLLAQVLEVSPTRVEELCQELADGYAAQERGFVLVKVAGGYRFQSHGDLAAYVERFVLEGQSARLSAAALETLAIVAYKQPMSRAQVAAIRGVNVDGVMRTLQQRGYIAETGRDPGPGQAVLFGTTSEFLERLGLASIDDLPPIGDLFPGTDIMEALERTLRADPVPAAPLPGQGTFPVASDADEPFAGQPDTPSSGADEPGPVDGSDDALDRADPVDPEPAESAEPVIHLDDVVDHGAVVDLTDDDDLSPPAWALDPDPSTDPAPAEDISRTDAERDSSPEAEADADADADTEPGSTPA